MKKQEKTQRSRERILEAALKEFGTKNYDSASINTICSESHLSKGLIYHNFKNKDALYLRCVALCYQEMMAYTREKEAALDTSETDIQGLLAIRQSFFAQHPYYSNIFFNTILQPPKHLISEIHALRKEFDAFQMERFEKMIRQLPLREGIRVETALEFFLLFSEMYNGYFRNKAEQTEDYKALIHAHEDQMAELFDIMLYGIAKQSS
ncbi:MAG: TetR/AcrR family transcriptional regulator [Lawsonibacter sp.]|jgi:AcrR family transcriptional regulator